MNDTESQMPAQGTDLEFQVVALQRQVFLLLLSLIVVTFTLVFYLYYQSHILTNDLDKYRPTALQVIKNYNDNAQVIANFESQVGNYAQAHPAFQQALKQYGIVPVSTPAK